jgi:hypothetical protein
VPFLTDELTDPPCPTRPTSPLETAEDAFTWLVTGPAPLAVNGRLLPGLPDRQVPLHQLRARLSSRPMRRSELDTVWAHLVVRARSSRLPARRAAWTLGCVGIAMPALAHVAAVHALDYDGDPADVEAAVLAAFVVELHHTDICVPRIPRRLRAAADRAARALADTVHTTRPATPADRTPATTAPATTAPATTASAVSARPSAVVPEGASAAAPGSRLAVTPAVMPRRRPITPTRPGPPEAATPRRGARTAVGQPGERR